ncbi:type I secretion C-terminal target domain-containing protein [Komarekiella sp. 'clone 1']|uniref:Type I secretion C-terminal target domain-containing protein n=1 Tax=Komarekiella delphini-convector SJRDD-AB1 TaxID=2593771 RepID=A0AA40SXY5_9NOST|nr:CARDB domain-containing protein [Komarekiella delphini-convector]MBD6617094.1 type I secretion C-terminal target domain-containing protein [Komarekiella delphini-convector SJRDD-AB1]
MVKPDLIVSSVTAPLFGYVNGLIDVSWTVTNQGEEITTANWYDYIYLSDDEFLDDNDLFVTSVSSENNTPLAAGDSYTTTQSTYIPYDATAGSRYLLFATDRNNDQSETNEDNNVFAQPITLTPSGLVISNVTAPSSAVLGETIRVYWTVTNQGNAIASSLSVDTIYISAEPYLDGVRPRDYNFYEVGSRLTEENFPLAPGASYTAYADIYLPSNKQSNSIFAQKFNFVGDRYIGVGLGGYSFLYNPLGISSYQPIPIQLNAPNLVVSDAKVLTPAVPGGTVDVSWTVTNQGEFYAPTDWYDAVYFSEDDVLDLYDDIFEKYQYDSKLIEVSIGEQTPLAAGASYTLNQTITIPNNIQDSGYLLFMVDANINGLEWERTGIQGETDENDNFRAVPINLAGLDFVVESATAPTSAASGETISVSWTVKNQSIYTALGEWYDNVYLSDDEFLDDEDIFFTQVSSENNTPLAGGDSYTITQNITIPDFARKNSRYLLFSTDRNNNLSETNEDNNVFAQPITLRAPDLVISNIIAPSSAVLGETIRVSWTVTNQGDAIAFADLDDKIYISYDRYLEAIPRENNFFSVGYRLSEGDTPLAPGASYTASADIFLPRNEINSYIPFNFLGDRYLVITTDNLSISQPLSYKESNILQAIPINLSAPNLVLSDAEVLTPAVTGGTVDVSWTVTNQGTVYAPADWNDAVFFSTNDDLDVFDLQLVEVSTEAQTPLAAGASYTLNQTLTIPNYTGGNGYLIFVADYDLYGRYENEYFGDGIQGETDATDNIRVVQIELTTLSAGVTITESDGSTNVTEGGATDTYTIALTSQPTADVAIALNSNAQITTSVNSLTFTAANWNQAQTITVTAVDDDVVEGNHTSTLSLTAASADASYNDIAIASINVSITDNDQLINGTSGRDTLVGSDGTDIITGFKGKDTLTGGAGSDQFVYTNIRDAGDEITDFVAGTDKIALLPLFQSLSLDNLNYASATTQGYLSFGTKGNNTTVLIDSDGLGGRGRSTTLVMVQGLDQATLANANNFLF